MEREIVLSSYSVKNQFNNKPEDFTTNFTRPIILENNKQYVIGLNRVINMSFTWFNVNAGYKNQLIKYSSDNGSTFKNITLPAGVWNYTDFNTYIKNLTETGKTYPITLEFDDTTFRVTVALAENYQHNRFRQKDISKWNAYWTKSAKSQSRHRNTQYSLRFN